MEDQRTAASPPPSGRGPLAAMLDVPLAVARQGQRWNHEVQRALARHAPARATLVVPRTARFVGATARDGRAERDGGDGGVPVPALSPALVAQVAIDELILAMAMGPNRFPRRSDYERVAAELAHARLLFEDRGWLAAPTTYHRTPPPLADPAVARGWALGQRYERLLFPSGWAPRDEEPGAARWAGYEPNRTAVATVLRHPGEPRPWVVAVHGFATGYPVADLIGLHALHLHRDLGCNVVLPVLPLHGPRKITRLSGEAFLSFDLINTVHGLTQAIWDIRRVLSWVRAQHAPAIAVYGVSLGAYVASLLVGLEDGLDAVVAGIPVVDFPEVFRTQSPLHVRLRAVEHEILDGNAEIVHRVVSPLTFAPRVPADRRFVYAGLGDRMAPPPQAHALWTHWDHPEMLWYRGNHVGYLWSRQVTAFLNDCLTTAGLVTEPALPGGPATVTPPAPAEPLTEAATPPLRR